MTRREWLGLAALLVVAGALRFVGLAGRGTWDADQGHDMLVVRSFVVDGVVPLLGPPTSIGTFHHGALYYWLLAPAGWLTGSDPTGVTAFIALAGIATVAATFWLARSIGGTRAGLIAGLFTVLSPAAIEQSTFIWNPNLIPVASAFALGSAWRAWSLGRARWWIGAAVGVGVVMQCHVLGATLLPPVAALWVADIRRAESGRRAPVVRAGLIGVALIALMYVPLLANELTHDFAESRAILAWISSGGGEGPALLARLPIVAWRVLAWPLAGLITDRPLVAGVAALVVIVALATRLMGARGAERTAVRWLGATLIWSILALTLAAPSLATIVAGLPNDHYHAFVDPIVIVLLALAISAVLPAQLWIVRRRAIEGKAAAAIGVGVAATMIIALLEVWAMPPATAWDGGWPGAEQSAARIGAVTGDRPIQLVSLPDLKSADAVRFPLVRAGFRATDGGVTLAPGTAIVVVCDPRFTELLAGGTCDGAVAAWTAETFPSGAPPIPAETFVASPQRTITIYLLDPPS